MSGMLAKGTPVISLDSGVTLGKVESVFLDCQSRRLVAFTFVRGGGLLGRRGGHIVEVDDIHAVGPDAVTLDDARAVHDLVLMDGHRRRLVELDQLVKRAVMTDGGQRLGHIVGLDFDPRTYRLLQLRVDGRSLEAELVIPADEVRGIGEEIIVVAERSRPAVAEDRVTESRVVERPVVEDRVAEDRAVRPTPAPTPIGGAWKGDELRSGMRAAALRRAWQGEELRRAG